MTNIKELIFYLLTTVFIAYQTPKEWWSSKTAKKHLLVFFGVGLSSILTLFFVYRDIPEGMFKYVLSVCINIYYAFVLNGLILCLFRIAAHYIVKRFKNHTLYQILFSKKIFFCLTVIFTIVYIVGGTVNTIDFDIKEYDINISKEFNEKEINIVELSDIHIGAGLWNSDVDRMINKIETIDYDLVLISGDIVDTTTSLDNIKHLSESLGRLHDVYFVEGNHDIECHYDYISILEEGGSIYVKDVITLDNGLRLVYGNEYKEEYYESSSPSITLRHIPDEVDAFAGKTDLVLYGHTHGFSVYLEEFITQLYYRHNTYGHVNKNNTHYITSSGASGWGFKLKWPAKDEIVLIHARFD